MTLLMRSVAVVLLTALAACSDDGADGEAATRRDEGGPGGGVAVRQPGPAVDETPPPGTVSVRQPAPPPPERDGISGVRVRQREPAGAPDRPQPTVAVRQPRASVPRERPAPSVAVRPGTPRVSAGPPAPSVRVDQPDPAARRNGDGQNAPLDSLVGRLVADGSGEILGTVEAVRYDRHTGAPVVVVLVGERSGRFAFALSDVTVEPGRLVLKTGEGLAALSGGRRYAAEDYVPRPSAPER